MPSDDRQEVEGPRLSQAWLAPRFLFLATDSQASNLPYLKRQLNSQGPENPVGPGASSDDQGVGLIAPQGGFHCDRSTRCYLHHLLSVTHRASELANYMLKGQFRERRIN